MQIIILANRHGDDTVLALRPVCGVPLVRRHLQVLRAKEWRDIMMVVASGDEEAIKEIIGDPGLLGVHLIYVQALRGEFPIRSILEIASSDVLIIEGHYVIEDALLMALAASETPVLLGDSQPEGHISLALGIQRGRVVAMGAAFEAHACAYAGATFLPWPFLKRLGADGESLAWPTGLLSHVPLRVLDVQQLRFYNAEVRKHAKPIWWAVETDADAEHCKQALVIGAQKHTLDVLAWYFNRPLENWLTMRIAHWPITPNQVTVLADLLAFFVTALFLMGRLWPASLLTFAVNILDGVDGKLARVKAMATKIGQLEHSFDLLYEQSWYIAFTWAVFNRRQQTIVLAIGFLMLLFDAFARHVSMQFRQVMGIPLADYAPFDQRFRRFDGRRNIYTIYILLGVILNRPFYALLAMALHAFITGVVYAWRAGLHLRAADQGVANITHRPAK